MNREEKITSKGYDKLQKELKELLEKREEIVNDLKIAYDYGDLRENSEFDSAKMRQALCDKRIKKIEYTLKHAKIVNCEKKNIVDIGSIVTIEYLQENQQESYELVGSEEISMEENKISYLSPLGKALMNNKVGDIVSVLSPVGIYQVKILMIMYPEK